MLSRESHDRARRALHVPEVEHQVTVGPIRTIIFSPSIATFSGSSPRTSSVYSFPRQSSFSPATNCRFAAKRAFSKCMPIHFFTHCARDSTNLAMSLMDALLGAETITRLSG
jgi:hypothetical protein